MKKYSFLFCLMGGLFSFSCGDRDGEKDNPIKPDNNQDEPVLEIVTVTDSETNAAMVITSVDDEQLIILSEKNSEGEITRITGGSYSSSDGLSFSFWFGNDGLPSIAISEDLVFIFSGYTTNTVDVSVTFPDGNVSEYAGIEVGEEKLKQLRQLSSAGKISQSDILQIAATSVRMVGTGLNIACCVSGIVTSPTGVGAVVAVACCGGAIFGTVDLLTDDDMAGTGSIVTSSLNCALSFNIPGCAGVGLEAIAREIEKAEGTRDEVVEVFPGSDVGSAEIIAEF